jgi:hypothetical protein
MTIAQWKDPVTGVDRVPVKIVTVTVSWKALGGTNANKSRTLVCLVTPTELYNNASHYFPHYQNARDTAFPIRGATLVESMVALFITVLIVTAMAAGLRTMAIGASQQVTDSGMGFDARRGVDEMLSHMRYGAAVVPSFTSGTKTIRRAVRRS